MNEDDDHELSGLIRAHATRYQASPALETAIQTEIALQSASARRPVSSSPWRWPVWGYAGVGFACGIVVSAIMMLVAGQYRDAGNLEGELTNSHVRALMANHLTDVASSDNHTVKPWFQGKLSYSPPVPDLAAQGFPLVGGRLDYLSSRAVAALVYRHNDHLINVFVWPDSGDSPKTQSVRQGYNLIQWREGGMQYWAVSDVNASELLTLSNLLH
ncbi:MAG: anti-sigma factor [Proteobacteria bacterium]|nr:anti-sigma factor [Pseudomonadota bacterium]